MSNKEDPAVLAHIKQENAYSATMLKPLETLRQQLFQEVETRQAISLSSLPVKRNGYWDYNKTEKGKEPCFVDRLMNKLNSSVRIVVENVIAGVKRCRIVKDLLRLN